MVRLSSSIATAPFNLDDLPDCHWRKTMNVANLALTRQPANTL